LGKRAVVFIGVAVMEDLDALYQWFDENREEIIQYYDGECVLLKNSSVIGYYPNMDTALLDAEKKGYALGEFLIQDCVSKSEDTMMYFNHAVYFG
jgi:hypothetical protein